MRLSTDIVLPLQLLHFLRPEWVPYHVRTVQLIWTLEHLTKHHHVQSVIAKSLIDPDNHRNAEAIEVFGVFWRLTGARST